LQKRIYPYIHKWHHSFYHTIAVASENAHPVEFFLADLIPVMLGPMILRAHILVTWMWLWVRISETISAHSGYEFPWSPARLTPFALSDAAHDYHHSHNKGSYGSQFVFWDTVCGTDKDFDAFCAKEEATIAGKKDDDVGVTSSGPSSKKKKA
jgi:sterol desaturase/sphingolipid hydroxylase (fatty acid hydroxylase superfamily)